MTGALSLEPRTMDHDAPCPTEKRVTRLKHTANALSCHDSPIRFHLPSRGHHLGIELRKVNQTPVSYTSLEVYLSLLPRCCPCLIESRRRLSKRDNGSIVPNLPAVCVSPQYIGVFSRP
ncbi:hypothetical protein NX059_001585 [Plenodomus lindquistii]|nr:hypothetical protein NX059_001585 [Plenodomus lindquistii]